ncbi:hypothetical protein BC939DRAFT_471197, partial [Gamsiella multidivaricata]|uniref:uncharacterized protein n=1 Tax=Gamsiella multidivaricata TaxID=101098 RepID=UPI00221ED0BB
TPPTPDYLQGATKSWREEHAAMQQLQAVLSRRIDKQQQEWEAMQQGWQIMQQRIGRLESKLETVIQLLQKQHAIPNPQHTNQDNEMEDAPAVVAAQVVIAPYMAPTAESAITVGKRHYRSLSGSDGSGESMAPAKMDKEQAIAQLQRELKEANERVESAENTARGHLAEVNRILGINKVQQECIQDQGNALQRLLPAECNQAEEDL